MARKQKPTRRARKKQARKNNMSRFIVGTLTTVAVAASGTYGLTDPVDLSNELRFAAPASQLLKAANEPREETPPTVTMTPSPTAMATPPIDIVVAGASVATTPTLTPTVTLAPTATSTSTPTSLPVACTLPSDEVLVGTSLQIDGTGPPNATILVESAVRVLGTAQSDGAGRWSVAVEFPVSGLYDIRCRLNADVASSRAAGRIVVRRPAPPAIQPPKDLPGAWALNDTEPVIKNLVGERFAFVGPNGVTYSADAPQNGLPQSLQLDGKSQFITTDAPISQDLDDLTMIIWAKWQGETGDSQLIFYNGVPGQDGYGLCTGTDGTLQLQVGAGTFDTPAKLRTEWQYLALVHASGMWKVYRDGEILLERGDTPPQAPTRATYIGGSDTARPSHFKGLVDHIRFYERALSVAELDAIARMKDTEFTAAGE